MNQEKSQKSTKSIKTRDKRNHSQPITTQNSTSQYQTLELQYQTLELTKPRKILEKYHDHYTHPKSAKKNSQQTMTQYAKSHSHLIFALLFTSNLHQTPMTTRKYSKTHLINNHIRI